MKSEDILREAEELSNLSDTPESFTPYQYYSMRVERDALATELGILRKSFKKETNV